MAVCGWTVASPSLRPRRFPRGTRRRRDVHETLLSILILVQLCVNHQSRRRLRRDWPPSQPVTIPRKSHFQAGNSFQIRARTHGTTDQAHGARVTGAGGERRVLRDRPATHGWHAGPGETTPHSREGRGQARAIRDRLRRGVRWDKTTPVLRTRRRRRASGLCQRHELGARRDAGRVPGCAVELRQAERQQVPDAGLLQRKVQEDRICPIGLFMDVQRLWVRVRDRQRVRLRPEEAREGSRDSRGRRTRDRSVTTTSGAGSARGTKGANQTSKKCSAYSPTWPTSR